MLYKDTLITGLLALAGSPVAATSGTFEYDADKPCPKVFWDADSDGFGDALIWVVNCAPPPGYVSDSTDCDDQDPDIGGALTYYSDRDQDGYGDINDQVVSCVWPDLYVDNFADCDDTDETIFIGAECDDGDPGTYDDQYQNDCQCRGSHIEMSARVFLEGPYTGGFMNDGLRVLGLLPMVEPYSALGYSFTDGGGEMLDPIVLAVTGPHAIVDWVILELRHDQDMMNIKYSRAALLRRDGQIVDTDGSPMVEVDVQKAEYYLVIRHRNHLPAMSLVPYQLGDIPVEVDFTVPGSTFGPASQKVLGQVTALWAGDVTGNNQIKYTGFASDRDPILMAIGGIIPTNTVTGYLQADVTLDGKVKYTGAGNDRDPILQNIGGVVPTQVRNAIMP